MRFKAKLTNEQLSVFHAVIAPMSKLQGGGDPSSLSYSRSLNPRINHRASNAVVYLDEDYVRISCKTHDTITCFAELSQQQLFWEHRIESAANNVIVLQVDLQSFQIALQSVMKSSSSSINNSSFGGNSSSMMEQQQQQQPIVILKLAKRNNLPCLCLEGRSFPTICGSSKISAVEGIEIYQAIPILILRQSEMQHHLPPQINHPQVQLELPIHNAPPLRAVVDKLKGMAAAGSSSGGGKSFILLEGNMKGGELTIRMDQDGASVACFYNHLVPQWPLQQQQEGNEEGEGEDVDNNNNNNNHSQKTPLSSRCVLKVDAHKLSTCLQWQQNHHSGSSALPLTSCLLGMVYNEMLILHVLLAPAEVGFFTYYLPVHYLQDDDDDAALM